MADAKSTSLPAQKYNLKEIIGEYELHLRRRSDVLTRARLGHVDSNWLVVTLALFMMPVASIAGEAARFGGPLPSALIFGADLVAHMILYYRSVGSLPRNWRRAMAVLASFVLCGQLIYTGIIDDLVDPGRRLATLGYIAVGALIPVCILWIQLRRETAPRWAFLPLPFLLALFFVTCSKTILVPFLALGISKISVVGDNAFLYFDRLLGLDIFIAIPQFLEDTPLAMTATHIAYDSVIIAIALSAFSELSHAPRLQSGLLLRTVVASIIGYIMYTFVPATGPAYYFAGDFPNNLPDVSAAAAWTAANTATPRNCLPSLHATWAILSWLSLRYSPRPQRWIGGGFVIMTFVGTIGLGEHYVIDWLAAPPLILLSRALTSRAVALFAIPRLFSAGAGSAFLVGWVVILRTASHDVIPVFVIHLFAWASFLAPFLMERWLARSERIIVCDIPPSLDIASTVEANPPVAEHAAANN